jgi:hypothetical protein
MPTITPPARWETLSLRDPRRRHIVATFPRAGANQTSCADCDLYYCLRAQGHDGPHVAYGTGMKEPLAWWPQDGQTTL